MADSASSPATLPSNSQPSESAPANQPDPVSQSSTPPSSTPLASNPNPNPTLLPPPPTVLYAPPQVPGVLPPSVPSFRPLAPQFSPVASPNPTYQNHNVPPPGVASAAGAVPTPVPQMQPMMSYHVPPGQPANPTMRPFAPIPNGYATAPQGTLTPAVS